MVCLRLYPTTKDDPNSIGKNRLCVWYSIKHATYASQEGCVFPGRQWKNPGDSP